ncbi:hypothetical protein [Nostoc sp.]|uniref:hypothetical protein n=1 Tax=Nostoc sp. TaxID=1180 RepID=UPI002FF47203
MTINDLRSKLAAYNTALSTIDKLTDDVNNAEQAVIAMSEKMLLGVGSRYGKTSQEYEMAGGARRGNAKKKQSVLGNSKVTNSLAADSVKLSSANVGLTHCTKEQSCILTFRQLFQAFGGRF